jgi:hypothetical protein
MSSSSSDDEAPRKISRKPKASARLPPAPAARGKLSAKQESERAADRFRRKMRGEQVSSSEDELNDDGELWKEETAEEREARMLFVVDDDGTGSVLVAGSRALTPRQVH